MRVRMKTLMAGPGGVVSPRETATLGPAERRAPAAHPRSKPALDKALDEALAALPAEAAPPLAEIEAALGKAPTAAEGGDELGRRNPRVKPEGKD